MSDTYQQVLDIVGHESGDGFLIVGAVGFRGGTVRGFGLVDTDSVHPRILGEAAGSALRNARNLADRLAREVALSGPESLAAFKEGFDEAADEDPGWLLGTVESRFGPNAEGGER